MPKQNDIPSVVCSEYGNRLFHIQMYLFCISDVIAFQGKTVHSTINTYTGLLDVML